MSPVIGTILMVAITVVLASVLYVLMSGTSAPPPSPVSIQFSNAPWNSGYSNSSVTASLGATSIPLSAITYVVRDPGGQPYFGGHSGDTQLTNGINVTVLYRDIDANDRVTAGDFLTIQVSPVSGSSLLEGGVIELYNEGRQIASHAI